MNLPQYFPFFLVLHHLWERSCTLMKGLLWAFGPVIKGHSGTISRLSEELIPTSVSGGILWGCCRKAVWSGEACGHPPNCREITSRSGGCPFTGHFLRVIGTKLLAWTGSKCNPDHISFPKIKSRSAMVSCNAWLTGLWRIVNSTPGSVSHWFYSLRQVHGSGRWEHFYRSHCLSLSFFPSSSIEI